MSNISHFKNKARVLSNFLKENDIDLSHGVCLNAIARLEGYKNWATLKATLPEDSSEGLNTEKLNESAKNLPLGLSSTIDADTLKAYHKVLSPLVVDFAPTTTVLSIMEALDKLCKANCAGSVEVWLRQSLKDDSFTLKAPHEDLQPRYFMNFLRKEAKKHI